MNEAEIIFNKLHDIYKNSVSNKKTIAILECAESINARKEEIVEIVEIVELEDLI